MSETIPIVRIEEAKEEAYDMGKADFEGGDSVDDPLLAFDHFTESAKWANVILPKLRCMAGYDDGGKGTWTQVRDVAIIEPHNEDDEPIEADVIESHYLLDELTEKYQEGALDALEV